MFINTNYIALWFDEFMNNDVATLLVRILTYEESMAKFENEIYQN
jgi:hypothetical protein